MKAARILAAVASLGLAAMSLGYAAGDDDLLIGGRTTFDKINYDPALNLLTVWGGAGDDKIKVSLNTDGSLALNGVALAKLGLRPQSTPAVAIHGGAGNDTLIAEGLPLAVMNGGEGQDILVWDNGDGAFARVNYQEDLVLWNSPETVFAVGGAGLDILIANTGGDREAVFGNLGRDVLLGGAGADHLEPDIDGGWGDDWISGGTGRD